jgi:lysophospholipase L1-like esterase
MKRMVLQILSILLTVCAFDCRILPAAELVPSLKSSDRLERRLDAKAFWNPPYLNARGGLRNSYIRFQREKQGRVAFLGGSITEMEGYRPMVCEQLMRRFPDTEFDFVNAGIASTCSTTGAFRLGRDVLAKGPVDLLLVEFAVNDQQDAAHTEIECIRGMEGILRQARRKNPNMDVVFLYFVNPFMMDQFRKGETPLPIRSHEKVAQHYAIPSLDLASEVTARIDAGEFDWEKFGGVHPAPFGNAIYAHAVERLMETCWKGKPAADMAVEPYEVPDSLDKWNYGDGILIGPEKAKADTGWTCGTLDWQSLKGNAESGS